ncbi:hypothetical protein PGTUg99_023965 [Puccinia graminis f. sp. tritici]|uniref:Uncharacterized protein n=1 Tax=Puccinia graminis f. sp. tritici TaxID=56615 RepID=A0A5B0P4P9_PUCGR|nr:hypothetical protein PGTUg99_023965 [Puccinia graminis f. sp. tritici]
MALAAFRPLLGFLVRNLDPVLTAAPAKTGWILRIGLFALHAIAIFTLILWFDNLSIIGNFEEVIVAPAPSEDVGKVPSPP